MGTRADYYVGRGEGAEWLGSSAYDGYPPEDRGPVGVGNLVHAASEAAFRGWVAARVACDDGTTPEMGWPWPWEDSSGTDYAWAWDDGALWASRFGGPWFRPAAPPLLNAGETAVFPDMSERQQITWGKRSGVMVVQLP